jgi:HlyD family secretion protein
MKKQTVFLLLLIPLAAVAGLLHKDLFFGGNSGSATAPFSVVRIERRILGQSVLATGIIKPLTGAEVKVGAQVSGIVQRLHVEIGSKVKKGELLAEIEHTGYKARADLALAQRRMAEAEMKFAERELHRYRALNEQKCISPQQMESVERSFEVSASRLQQTQAELDYALLQLSYTQIRSPIDGTVSSVATQEGETVAANFTAPTFVTIIDPDRLELWAYVDETDIGRVRKGQRGIFTVDTWPGEEFHGVVKTVYPKAEIQNNVVNYVAVITLEQQSGRKIRPEMTTNVRIYSENTGRVPVLPVAALHTEGGRPWVLVPVNGTPQRRYVETGPSDKRFIEIRSGVAEGEDVIAGEIPAHNSNTSGDEK